MMINRLKIFINYGENMEVKDYMKLPYTRIAARPDRKGRKE